MHASALADDDGLASLVAEVHVQQEALMVPALLDECLCLLQYLSNASLSA